MGRAHALATLECASAKHRLNWNDRSLLEIAAQYIDNQASEAAFEEFVERIAKEESEGLKKKEKKGFKLAFPLWCQNVDTLFKQKTCCNWADLCGDAGPREQAFEAGDTPGEFVRWYCEKYGLGRDEE